MNKEVKELRKKFKKYDIDGYVVPKNDDYFTEYSKINRLKIISNFSGSAGLAVVLKDKNYFTATKILAKHDENYMPPEVKEALGDK